MCYRFLSRVVAASLLGLAGMSVGCADSPSSPTPGPTPSTPPAGLTVTSITPSSGPTVGGDFIRVFGGGFESGATVLLDGVAARVTKVTETVIDAQTLAHSSGTVDVVVLNQDGKTATLTAAYAYAVFSVTGSPSFAEPGADLTVSWAAPSGRGCSGGGDWIALYRVGDPDQTGASNGHSDIWYDHVCGATSGSWTLRAPAQPGRYEFRFMVGDFSVARSDQITIREPAATHSS